MALLPLDLSASPGRACDGLSSTQACVRGVLPPKRLSEWKSCAAAATLSELVSLRPPLPTLLFLLPAS